MKMLISLNSIPKIGLARELHDVMNLIYYLDIEKDHILEVARAFFKAFRLYLKMPTPELYTFVYGSKVKERMVKAFTRQNAIDGEIMQRALYSDKELGEGYKLFNKEFQNHVEPPSSWMIPGTPEHRVLLNHFKSERNLHKFRNK